MENPSDAAAAAAASKEDDQAAVAAAAAPSAQEDDSKRSRLPEQDGETDNLTNDDASSRPRKQARTEPNAIATLNSNLSASSSSSDDAQQQDDADGTTTLGSSITYYILRDAAAPQEGSASNDENLTEKLALGEGNQEQALPRNTVVRMRLNGKTLDLRVGDVVLLSGGDSSDSSESNNEEVSLTDENAPPPPPSSASGQQATSASGNSNNGNNREAAASLWTARIEGFTGGSGDGAENNISFTARWFLSAKDIQRLPTAIPWVGPVSREALLNNMSSSATATVTEVVLSSKIDDNDIACIRGRAMMQYNPTDEELAAAAATNQSNDDSSSTDHVFFCRYHLDVSDASFSSYRLSRYNAELHAPGIAIPTQSPPGNEQDAAVAAAMDTFALDNTMGSLSGQQEQQQKQQQEQHVRIQEAQPEQQEPEQQQQEQQQQQSQEEDDDDESDDSSSTTDEDEHNVEVEGEGSTLRESIAVGMMYQAVVGPFVPGQLHARCRNPKLVWKASRHYKSDDNISSMDDKDDKMQTLADATKEFQTFLDRLAKVHTPFLNKHHLSTTDPYSPLPAEKAEQLQRLRLKAGLTTGGSLKAPQHLTGSFLSTASMLNVNHPGIISTGVASVDATTEASVDAAQDGDKKMAAVPSTDKATDQVGDKKAAASASAPATTEQGSDKATAAPTAADRVATSSRPFLIISKAYSSTEQAADQNVAGKATDQVAEKATSAEQPVDMDIDKKQDTVDADKKQDTVDADKEQAKNTIADEGKTTAEKKDEHDAMVVDTPKEDENRPPLGCDLRKECVAEEVYELWTDSNGNVDAAIAVVEKDLASGEGRFTTGWTTDEKKLFDDGFRETQGELREIAKRLAPRKSLKDVVDFYYRFKIPDQFRKYQDKKRELALRMMDCIEKRRFYDPQADSLNNNAGGAFSRRGSASGDKSWEETTTADVAGATEERRQKARVLLLDVQAKLGNEIMAEVMDAVRKLNRSYDGETRNSLFHLLKGHSDLQKRFSDFLPRHF